MLNFFFLGWRMLQESNIFIIIRFYDFGNISYNMKYIPRHKQIPASLLPNSTLEFNYSETFDEPSYLDDLLSNILN